jgi:hypothetical protein
MVDGVDSPNAFAAQATKIALLEANQEYMGREVKRIWEEGWPRMEKSLREIAESLNAIKAEQTEAKLIRQAAEGERKAFKVTLNGFTETLATKLDGIATKSSVTALETRVEGEIKTVAAIQLKQTEHDALLNQWKGKVVVIGTVGVVLIGAVMKLVDGGLKAWLF